MLKISTGFEIFMCVIMITGFEGALWASCPWFNVPFTPVVLLNGAGFRLKSCH